MRARQNPAENGSDCVHFALFALKSSQNFFRFSPFFVFFRQVFDDFCPLTLFRKFARERGWPVVEFVDLQKQVVSHLKAFSHAEIRTHGRRFARNERNFAGASKIRDSLAGITSLQLLNQVLIAPMG